MLVQPNLRRLHMKRAQRIVCCSFVTRRALQEATLSADERSWWYRAA